MPKARNSGVRSPVFPKVDENCSLQCTAEGWPKPGIFWMKEDKNISVINQDHKYRESPNIQSEGDGPINASKSELVIFNIQMEDSGKYYCVATNPVGVDKYPIRVQAEGDDWGCPMALHITLLLTLIALNPVGVLWVKSDGEV